LRYKAKNDWFVGVSMLVGIAAPAFIAVTQDLPWMSIASVIAAALVFGISIPQWYETKSDALIIRSGLTTRVIPYARIKAVKPSADQRIAIDYGLGNLLIAPQNAQEFIADIAARAPQLSKQGSELVVTQS
jgi:membrane protein YdbS with pleckstrin-like domain